MSVNREPSEPVGERRDPSLLNHTKSAILDFIRLRKKPSGSAYGGALFMMVMGYGLGGPVGAVTGTLVGAVTGEVVDRGSRRGAQ